MLENVNLSLFDFGFFWLGLICGLHLAFVIYRVVKHLIDELIDQ